MISEDAKINLIGATISILNRKTGEIELIKIVGIRNDIFLGEKYSDPKLIIMFKENDMIRI